MKKKNHTTTESQDLDKRSGNQATGKTSGRAGDRSDEYKSRVEQYQKRLENVRLISESILSLQSPKSIAQILLSQIHQFVPYARGSVMEFNFRTRKARLLAVQMDYKTKVEPDLMLHLDETDGAFSREPEVYVVQDVRKLTSPSPIENQLSEEGIRAVLTVPLNIGNELVGLLNLGAREAGVFTDDMIEMVKELTALLTISIRQARLSEQTQRDTQTKSILVDEINHRVKNNLSAIIGLLYAKQNSFESDKKINAGEMIHELVTSIQGMSTVHQMLSASEWSPISLSDLTIQIIASVLNMTVGRHVPFHVNPSVVMVHPEQANNLALIINELTINFGKHVLTISPDAQIRVSIGLKNNAVFFEFSDDGPGFPSFVTKEGKHNVGLYLVTEMVRRNLKGTIRLFNQKGAHIKISFQSMAGDTTHV